MGVHGLMVSGRCYVPCCIVYHFGMHALSKNFNDTIMPVVSFLVHAFTHSCMSIVLAVLSEIIYCKAINSRVNF